MATTNIPRQRYRADAFSEITDESAYWIGFLMADGCISAKGLEIALTERDVGHVEKLRDFIQARVSIGYRPPRSANGINSRASCHFAIRAPELVADLITHGVIPRKSATGTRASTTLAHNCHFWRGMVDGDGHIGWVERPPRRYARIVLYACRDISAQFADFCKAAIGHRPTVRAVKGVFRTEMCGERAAQTIRRLYAISGERLHRKGLVAISIISAHPYIS